MENLTIIDSYTKQDAIQDGSQIDKFSMMFSPLYCYFKTF